jgi:hypothetical protein
MLWEIVIALSLEGSDCLKAKAVLTRADASGKGVVYPLAEDMKPPIAVGTEFL